MERATVSACSCWPAWASAPATAASACAGRVGDGAGHGRGLLVLAGLGQRPGHRRQRLRLPVRVGDGAGHGLGPGRYSGGLLALPAWASTPATAAAPAGPGR